MQHRDRELLSKFDIQKFLGKGSYGSVYVPRPHPPRGNPPRGDVRSLLFVPLLARRRGGPARAAGWAGR